MVRIVVMQAFKAMTGVVQVGQQQQPQPMEVVNEETLDHHQHH
jgi:hypothetical protein